MRKPWTAATPGKKPVAVWSTFSSGLRVAGERIRARDVREGMELGQPAPVFQQGVYPRAVLLGSIL